MTPFHPKAASTVSLAATTTSSNTTLLKQPNQGPFQMRVYNAGTATVFFSRGDSTATATTSASMPIPPGVIEVITVNSPESNPVTHVAAITATGTATVYVTVGEGV